MPDWLGVLLVFDCEPKRLRDALLPKGVRVAGLFLDELTSLD